MSKQHKHIVITYYDDGTEGVTDAYDEESTRVDYLLQRDAMRQGSTITCVRRAVVMEEVER